MDKSYRFRENIRILERKFGMLNKECGCCFDGSLAQCHALIEIGRRESISLKELACILCLDISTMSRTVDNLVKRNYVYRKPSDEDRRKIEISLTDEGQDMFVKIECSMKSEFEEVFKNIPENERNNVVKSLQIIIDAFNSNCSKE